MNATDIAIQTLHSKIATLQLAIAEIEAARDAMPAEVAGPAPTRTRKPRKPRGLPSAQPPASDANYKL